MRYVIRLRFVDGLDAMGRMVAIMRRSKVRFLEMYVEMGENPHMLVANVEGPENEVMWLVNKLWRNPEILSLEVIQDGVAVVRYSAVDGEAKEKGEVVEAGARG